MFKGEAQDSYKQGDYVTAYAKLEGVKIKSADEDFYNRTALLAAIQEEYDSYQSMMQIGETEMALDCLIRGVGRCDNHAEKAEEYGVTAEVDGLKNQMTQTLTDVFGVDEQQGVRGIWTAQPYRLYTGTEKNTEKHRAWNRSLYDSDCGL